MQKRIGHVMALTIAAGMLAAIAPAATFAQDEGSSIVPAVSNINANKVDGKHAVGAKASRAKRRGKLVATNRQGYLPSNIVKPAWHLILGVPAPFADGVDNEGITGLKLTTYTSTPLAVPLPGGPYAFDYSCPSGKLMSGGYHNGFPSDVFVNSSFPLTPTTWRIWARSSSATSRVVYIWLNCMTTEPAGGIAARLSPSSKNAVSTASKGAGRK